VYFDYGSLMDELEDLAPDLEDKGVKKEQVRFRAVPALKAHLEALAAIETQVRRMNPEKRGVITVNKMLTHICERFLVAYRKQNGAPLPPPKDKAAVAAYAAEVVRRRAPKK
jgi:citrate synthase